MRTETTETKTIRRRRGNYDDIEPGKAEREEARKRTPPVRQREAARRSEVLAAAVIDPQRPDVPSPELATDTEDEDEDIFERAMRKYGIVLDDSD